MKVLVLLMLGVISNAKAQEIVCRPCKNGASCVDGSPDWCLCFGNYYGKYCEIEAKINCKESNPCKNGGSCLVDKCYCPTCHFGVHCQFTYQESKCLADGR